MSPIRLALRIEGIAQLQRKLRADVLLAPPLREAMTTVLNEATGIVESRAPRRTGRLAASVTHRLDAHPVPTWGRIAVTARSNKSKKYPRGYPYGKWLEYSPKSPWRGWFLASLLPARALLERQLAAAARRIEAIWGI